MALAAGGTVITSASFSPPASALLVIVTCSTAGTQNVVSMSDSLGAHLTYTKLAQKAGNSADVDIWVADTPAVAPGNMTVSATMSGTEGTNAGSIVVLVLTGAKAAASQTGATATATASGNPSLSLTTTAASSLVLGGVAQFTNSTAPTIPSGQTDVFNGHTMEAAGAAGSASWTQGQSSTTPASGTSVTINDTAPNIAYSMAIVEILAAPAAPAVVAAMPMMVGQAVQASAVR